MNKSKSLHDAVLLAKKYNLPYVTIDKDREIYIFKDEPTCRNGYWGRDDEQFDVNVKFVTNSTFLNGGCGSILNINDLTLRGVL